ncbi:hypothetical protein [Micromonospora sp. NPDC051141]|uniref:hypothetical protein n=1 Tax=Micromonospora sp. NPDC051141 TaxID=3364284 RepID=UPI0037AD5747
MRTKKVLAGALLALSVSGGAAALTATPAQAYYPPILGPTETIEGTHEGAVVCSWPTICTSSDFQRADNIAYPPARDQEIRLERTGLMCRLYKSTDQTNNVGGPNLAYVKYWVICKA